MADLTPSTLRIGHRYRASRLRGPYDALIIGSGIGGLTTAALLSGLCRRVAVLEQHCTAGGATHSYDRAGCEWDVGVHYIGDVGADGRALRPLLHWRERLRRRRRSRRLPREPDGLFPARGARSTATSSCWPRSRGACARWRSTARCRPRPRPWRARCCAGACHAASTEPPGRCSRSSPRTPSSSPGTTCTAAIIRWAVRGASRTRSCRGSAPRAARRSPTRASRRSWCATGVPAAYA